MRSRLTFAANTFLRLVAVGAETFAVTKPSSNNKLNKDLVKLATRPEAHRYIFFSAPGFQETKRLPRYERDGVEVWSVAV